MEVRRGQWGDGKWTRLSCGSAARVQCPLVAISGHAGRSAITSASPPKADIVSSDQPTRNRAQDDGSKKAIIDIYRGEPNVDTMEIPEIFRRKKANQ